MIVIATGDKRRQVASGGVYTRREEGIREKRRENEKKAPGDKRMQVVTECVYKERRC